MTIKSHLTAEGACVCPPPRGGPWKPLLRVSVFGMLSASLRFVFAIMYGYMLWSCLVCSLSLLVLAPMRGRSGRTFSGVPVLFLNLESYCATGGGYLGGGASAPRYQGPPVRLSREAGRPMGPSTPRCSSQSCAFVCLVSCWGLGSVFGKFKKVWCFGTSILYFEPFKLRPCKVPCFLCFGVPGWGCIVPMTVVF